MAPEQQPSNPDNPNEQQDPNRPQPNPNQRPQQPQYNPNEPQRPGQPQPMRAPNDTAAEGDPLVRFSDQLVTNLRSMGIELNAQQHSRVVAAVQQTMNEQGWKPQQ